jgi:hypothetical protein
MRKHGRGWTALCWLRENVSASASIRAHRHDTGHTHIHNVLGRPRSPPLRGRRNSVTLQSGPEGVDGTTTHCTWGGGAAGLGVSSGGHHSFNASCTVAVIVSKCVALEKSCHSSVASMLVPGGCNLGATYAQTMGRPALLALACVGGVLLAGAGAGPVDAPPPSLVDVFVAGEGGYACYRIPAMVQVCGDAVPPPTFNFHPLHPQPRPQYSLPPQACRTRLLCCTSICS